MQTPKIWNSDLWFLASRLTLTAARGLRMGNWKKKMDMDLEMEMEMEMEREVEKIKNKKNFSFFIENEYGHSMEQLCYVELAK